MNGTGPQLHAPATTTAAALTLRPWAERDLPSLVEAYDDPVMLRSTQHPVTDGAEAIRWLEERARGWATGTRPSFAVFEGTRLVAHISLRHAGFSGTADTAEVGYWTVAAARGRGVAPRALEAVTAWAFSKAGMAGMAGMAGGPGLNRLELLHQVNNPASCRVAEKAGYGYERTLAPHPPFPLEGHLHGRVRVRAGA
ncbi:GNAT family N-acetyltransferase [Streptomyces liangshanensis]|uniref:GNAT family N-acetyltransferase n=1 Tax=Streptomyces liangshanensis TaxID=2717324 RepID=A0A6G9H1M9_9ACTN|nr:GNAT family N-acetyltransferase [Streptomyces liangshanensis]QIQ04226.1 GNAT family N-acetyltransferase [Streptomyces liangshanensis]